MKPILYIKYGELTLKGKNRMQFVKCLHQNIKNVLSDFEGLLVTHYFDYLKIENVLEDTLDEVIKLLSQVPGIHSISLAYEMSDDINLIKEHCLEIAQQLQTKHQFQTFKIEARRQNKAYFLDSLQIKNIVAGNILEHTDYKVQLKHPDLTINIEIKNNNLAIVYGQQFKGMGGLPVGSNGKVLVLLSGGIDSPVAARLLMNRGLAVDFVTFITPPHTSEKALQKVRDLAKTITLNNRLCRSKLYVCDFSSLQHELTHIYKESYRITLMRRYFFRIAKALALKHHHQAIATGESIGQVASQTLESMQAITDVLDDFLILRPLLTFDKEEIIAKAKKFNTYELSILPYNDSCSLFAPKNPVTHPTIETAEKLEASLDLINSILENVIDKHTWTETYDGTEFRNCYQNDR